MLLIGLVRLAATDLKNGTGFVLFGIQTAFLQAFFRDRGIFTEGLPLPCSACPSLFCSRWMRVVFILEKGCTGLEWETGHDDLFAAELEATQETRWA
jgi:hypothetical protein